LSTSRKLGGLALFLEQMLRKPPIEEASVFKEKLKSVFVINRKIVNTAIGRDVSEALAGYKLPVLRSQVCQRVSFAESAAGGLTVFESDPKGQAVGEIKALVDELLKVL
jgi:chromosome partitioning protein